MRPRYIAPRRAAGQPCRHLTARRLRHMQSRFERTLRAAALAAGALAWLLW